MISKLRFSLIAVILLVLLGFGFHDQAKGQPGTDSQFCPGVEISNGWLQTRISPDALAPPDFSAALMGTVEGSNGNAIAGLDWQHVELDFVFDNFDDTIFFTNLPRFLKPTNRTGGQLVSWWTQKEGRESYFQITETLGNYIGIHVHIFDENCVEIRDFCDIYTPGDTHVYNLGDLVTNDGQTPDDSILQDKEGFITFTVVDSEDFLNDLDGACPDSDQAIDYNWLAGTAYIVDPADYMYGVNMYARYGVCFDELAPFENLVLNGSFQDGDLPPWSQTQGGLTDVITEDGISPQVQPPACNNTDNPDCDDPDADTYMGYVASDPNVSESNYYKAGTPLGDPELINTGLFETNVTVLESNSFNSSDSIDNMVHYDLAFLAPLTDGIPVEAQCDNYAAVCTTNSSGQLYDCNCYNTTGDGSIIGGGSCADLATDNVAYAVGPASFPGGRSSFLLDETLRLPGGTSTVQVITGQIGEISPQCSDSGFPNGTGALVDNVYTLAQLPLCDFSGEFIFEGNNTLNGFNAFYLPFVPSQFAGQFNVLPGNEGNAGADVVHINFADRYSPNYSPVAAFINTSSIIYDDEEIPASCGDAKVCFVRLGIDADIVISEDFTPASPSASPTATPTIGPVSPTPTPTQTNRPRGSSSSCAITGPVQLGTAMANVLIPLIPLAFVFGIRAVRRRKK